VFTEDQELAFNLKDYVLELKQDRVWGQVTDRGVPKQVSSDKKSRPSCCAPLWSAGWDHGICDSPGTALGISFLPPLQNEGS